MTTKANKPVKTYKLGRVKASIWENKSADGHSFYAASFERSYRDSEGKWHNTKSFGLKDMLNLIRLSAQTVWFMSFANSSRPKDDPYWDHLGVPEDY